MQIARRFLISGNVQGVGYRFFALRAARLLGVRGWVRNLPSGEVEVLAEGEEVLVKGLRRELESGPPAARVHRIEEQELAPSGRFAGFEISYSG